MTSVDVSDPVGYLEQSIRKQRKVLMIVGAVLGLPSLIGLVAALLSEGAMNGDKAAGVGAIGFFLLIGAACFVVGLRATADRDVVLRALRDAPSQIVWIYEKDTKTNANTFHKVVVCTAAGQEKEIDVKSLEAQVALRNALAQRCPGAVTGYTSDRALAFKQNPAQLARG